MILMQPKKIISRHSDKKAQESESSVSKGQYTYKYTFYCSECKKIVKEITNHHLETFIKCNEVCPNGCNSAIEMKCDIIEVPKLKYTKDNPYKR